MDTLSGKLIGFLSKNGLKASIIDYSHAIQLIEEIDDRHETGGLDDAIYKRYLAKFRERFSESNNYKSIIVMAAPQMAGTLEFDLDNKIHTVTIPPTYVYGENEASVRKLVKSYLEPLGYAMEKALLPNKLLAVRSGLGSYGRNNICYVPGLGSFHRIISFFTDMPCENDNWQEAVTMERCISCKICIKNCPTNCISEERFLIHAETCLTHLNENGGEFPDWLDPKVHNAVVGCMACQESCPENRELMKGSRLLESFNQEQTRMILNRTPFNELPGELSSKLDNLSLSEYYDVLPRNLKVLIEKG